MFSHIFNKAREWGATDRSNPCVGVRKHRESGRDGYIDDAAYRKLWEKADVPLREAMDLAYLTGQRPADVLKLDERHIRDGVLEVRQNKTRAKLRIEIVGQLASAINRIASRKSGLKLHSTKLIVDESGNPLARNSPITSRQGRVPRLRRPVAGGELTSAASPGNFSVSCMNVLPSSQWENRRPSATFAQ